MTSSKTSATSGLGLSDEQTRRAALYFARGRSLLGLGLTLLPGPATRIGVGIPSAPARALMRMVGVRDLAIGLGAVAGVREGIQAPEWLGWGAVADGVDALALLLTPGLPKRARLAGLLAAGGAVAGMKLAWDLADQRAREQTLSTG
jgi:hypothetical protein